MKIRALCLASCLSLVSSPIYAANTNTTLATDQDKLSYSLGLEIGNNIKQGFKDQKIAVSPSAFSQGIEDAVAGNTPALSPKQVEAILASFQQNQDQAQEQAAQQAILDNSGALFNSKTSPMVGNVDSNIVMVEFFDYQCVHCRRMGPVVDQLLDGNKKLRIIYKEFPILGEGSVYASKAALAAQKQGKYFPFHEALLALKDRLTEESVLKVATQVGLNIDQLKKDMNDASVEKEIQDNYQLANKLGIQGTPAFVIADTSTLKDKTPKVFFVPGAAEFPTLAGIVEQVQGNGFKYPNRAEQAVNMKEGAM